MNRNPAASSRIAWTKWLPILAWGRAYDSRQFGGDLLAAGIVTLMLIPQSLAYAMLAGLPPQAGLYASMLPLLAYAVFGSSRTLAVGPAAVTSLMTATAIGQLAVPGTPAYWEAALVLALLSGGILLLMGLLRLGWLANFLGHPVIAGFIAASGLLIAVGQAKHVLGIRAQGDTLPVLLPALWRQLPAVNWPTLVLGVGALVFLWWSRQRLGRRLRAWGWRPGLAEVLGRSAPVLAIAVTTLAVWAWDLQAQGVQVVGAVPQGLPPLAWPSWNPSLWSALAMPALLLSLVGFAESVSVGQTLAARRRQRVEPDQELVALGASNVAAAFSGGLPVTGGFSRSVVNFDAGARTPAAGVYTALGIALAAVLLTPLLHYLPQATLAATVIVAVLSLVDVAVFRRIWEYSRFDFSVAAATLLLTLLAGVETGLVAGVVLALALHLYRSSRPHVAEVGQVPGTEHFRNVRRHTVTTCDAVLGLRVDESLYFANARYLEDCINDAVARRQALKHVVLQCSAINNIDASALASLEMIEVRLRDAGICLHLSEVKGPVMDRLANTAFLRCLSGQVFLTHYQAIAALAPGGLSQ